MGMFLKYGIRQLHNQCFQSGPSKKEDRYLLNLYKKTA